MTKPSRWFFSLFLRLVNGNPAATCKRGCWTCGILFNGLLFVFLLNFFVGVHYEFLLLVFVKAEHSINWRQYFFGSVYFLSPPPMWKKKVAFLNRRGEQRSMVIAKASLNVWFSFFWLKKRALSPGLLHVYGRTCPLLYFCKGGRINWRAFSFSLSKWIMEGNPLRCFLFPPPTFALDNFLMEKKLAL